MFTATVSNQSANDVVCLGCGARTSRTDVQVVMLDANPGWRAVAAPAPDGDADIDAAAVDAFVAPRCARCGGVLNRTPACRSRS